MIRKICQAFVAVLAAAPLLAATHTWSGAASASFADGANWTGGSPAGDAAADLVFPAGGSNTNATNDLAALTVHSITFSGGTYTIGGNPITVTSAVSASGGVISGATGTLACDINVSSSLTLTGGRLTLSGSIGGSGSVTVHGSAPAGVTFAGSKANTYTGETIAVTDLNLAKAPGVIAIPGNLTVVPSNYPYPLPSGATCLTSGQINPDAVVTINAGWLTLGAGTTTTLHHLMMQSTRSLSAGIDGPGRLIVDNDILFGQQQAFPAPAYIQAELNLPHTLTFDIAPAFLALSNVTGPGGLTVLSGMVGATGTFTGPATASGANAQLSVINPAAHLTVTDGATGGYQMQSALIQHGGTLAFYTGGSVAGDLTLDGASALLSSAISPTDPESPKYPFVPPTVGGTVTLGGAALKWSTSQRAGGAQYTLIDNRGSSPVNGTFAGIPEGGTTPDGLYRVTYRGGDGNDVVVTDISRQLTGNALDFDNLVGDQPTTLTVTLTRLPTPLPSLPSPTGTVSFTDNGAAIGTAIVANGQAHITFPLVFGSHSITETYSGDTVYEPSSGRTLSFTLSYPTPFISDVTPRTLQAGGSATLELTGDHFYAPLQADVHPGRGTLHFISSTRATLDLDLTAVTTAGSLPVRVTNDGTLWSNTYSLDITVPLPRLAFGADLLVPEGDAGTTQVQVPVMLHGTAVSPVTVNWATSDGTAIAGRDYVSAAGALRFLPGEAVKSISVSILGNTALEANRAFSIVMSNPANASITHATTVVTILDDDGGLPQVSAGNVRIGEGDRGTVSLARIPITLSSPSASVVTVHWATVDDTALGGPGPAGFDYRRASGTVSFDPGETLRTISVEVAGDDVAEGDERFFIALDSPLNATVAGGGSCTIVDDDAHPAVSLADAEVKEGTGGASSVTVVATLSAPQAAAVTATYETVDGTAKAGSDYVGTSGQITFLPGQMQQTISIPLFTDAVPEPNESFRVELTGVSGAVLGTDTAVVTIDDDDSATPSITVDDSAVLEGSAGTSSSLLFTVKLSHAATSPVTVAYATTDGSATAPEDYTAGAGTLTFAPGETAKTVAIVVQGDDLFERDEDFLVTLSNATGAAIARATACGTIRNDDKRRRAAAR